MLRQPAQVDVRGRRKWEQQPAEAPHAANGDREPQGDAEDDRDLRQPANGMVVLLEVAEIVRVWTSLLRPGPIPDKFTVCEPESSLIVRLLSGLSGVHLALKAAGEPNGDEKKKNKKGAVAWTGGAIGAMTAVIVKPELMPGSASAPHAHGFTTLVALAHA